MNDSAWHRLLEKIAESNVVPIIGSRLLVDAGGESLQAKIAKRLVDDAAKSADRPLPPLPTPDPSHDINPFRELNSAISVLKEDFETQDLYDMVNDAMRCVLPDNVLVPAPIRQLAQISGFRLYVTLTPDDLLARSLRQRVAVNEIVHSPNLPTSEGKDLPADWKDRGGEVQLLYLFGKARSAPMFAIHDEDVLEYAHNVISHGSQVPIAFLAELQQRNLLLLGCNFPDWLTRFFLRATNLRRLSEKDRRTWLIEPLRPEESLTVFLRCYSKETEILSQDSPVKFVDELYTRWMTEYGAAAAPAGSTEEKPQPPRAMFFLSYSRPTDVTNAESLYQALLKQGVGEGDVWFDRKTIDPGQDFQRKIVDGIGGCRYFLPVISKAVDQRSEGWVFTEWDEACKRLPQMNREFVLPVIVDAEFSPEVYNAHSVWEWRQRHIDFGWAPAGVPDARLADTLKRLVREARRGGEAS